MRNLKFWNVWDQKLRFELKSLSERLLNCICEMRDEEQRLSSDTLHWYSACIAHHRQPVVTAFAGGSHVIIEAEGRLETQFGKKQKVNLWKAAAGVTEMKSLYARSRWAFLFFSENRIIGYGITIKKSPWDLWIQFWEKVRLDEYVEHYCCFNISKDASRSFPSSAGEPQVWMGAASSSGADPACVSSVEQIFSCGAHQSAVCPVKKVHSCGQ